jgi:hypothetical protein
MQFAVSPDGRLLQASTEADVGSFTFAGGHVAGVPRSYIEFAERLVLPEFEHLPRDEVRSSGSLQHLEDCWTCCSGTVARRFWTLPDCAGLR